MGTCEVSVCSLVFGCFVCKPQEGITCFFVKNSLSTFRFWIFVFFVALLNLLGKFLN